MVAYPSAATENPESSGPSDGPRNAAGGCQLGIFT
jgi:hypothetical protein